MRAGMIGFGNLGSAVANMIAWNGYDVLGWEYNPSVVEEVNSLHTNNSYLQGVPLDPRLKATKDLNEVFAACEIVFLAIPSIYIQSTLGGLAGQVDKRVIIVNMAKGIDRQTGLTAFQTVASIFPSNPKIMLSGPAIANEFAHQKPTVVVLAGSEFDCMLKIAHMMDND